MALSYDYFAIRGLYYYPTIINPFSIAAARSTAFIKVVKHTRNVDTRRPMVPRVPSKKRRAEPNVFGA